MRTTRVVMATALFLAVTLCVIELVQVGGMRSAQSESSATIRIASHQKQITESGIQDLSAQIENQEQIAHEKAVQLESTKEDLEKREQEQGSAMQHVATEDSWLQTALSAVLGLLPGDGIVECVGAIYDTYKAYEDSSALSDRADDAIDSNQRSQLGQDSEAMARNGDQLAEAAAVNCASMVASSTIVSIVLRTLKAGTKLIGKLWRHFFPSTREAEAVRDGFLVARMGRTQAKAAYESAKIAASKSNDDLTSLQQQKDALLEQLKRSDEEMNSAKERALIARSQLHYNAIDHAASRLFDVFAPAQSNMPCQPEHEPSETASSLLACPPG